MSGPPHPTGEILVRRTVEAESTSIQGRSPGCEDLTMQLLCENQLRTHV